MIASADSFHPPSLDHLHAAFLALVPRIETHAGIVFRGVHCPDTRADLVSETIALAWKWFVGLAARNKDATRFASTLACLAARAVKCGRRLAGQEKAKDVMSPAAQRRHGFTVERLPLSTRIALEDLYSDPQGQRHLDAYEERLVDNTQTPVADAAAFRVDFPEWIKRQTERDRRIIDDMSRDERTRDLAHKYGVSPGRVAQWRQKFQHDWQRFHGEPDGASDRQRARAG
jgi:hypothetical protein